MAARPLPRVLSLLGVEKDPAVDDALREALPYLRADACVAALKLICERGRSSTLAGLVVRCGSFPPDLREAIYSRLDLFHTGLREALASKTFEDRAAAIGVIVAANDYKSAHWLAESLRASCPRTRELAAGAICKLTEQHVARRKAGITPQQAADFHLCADRLGDMHRNLMEHWESHTRTDVFVAGLWMMESVEAVLAAKLAQPQNRIRAPLLKILSGVSDRRLARFALWALTQADLKTAAAQALAGAADSGFMEAVVEEAWLLADPDVAKSFHGIHDVSQWKQWASNQRLTIPQASAVVRMMGCAGGPRERIVDQLLGIAQHAAPPVRHAVLWQLVQDESPCATQKLAEIGARTDDGLAPIAARESRRRQLRHRPAGGAARTADPSRAWKTALERFIEEYDRLSPAERDTLASQLRSFVDVRRCILEKLESRDAAGKAQTIRAMEALELSSALRTALYQCAHDADATVRAAALHALGDDAGPTAARVFREALNDPEPRVQAAAIEAMEKLGVEKNQVALRAKLDSRSHRVRANAIKALWNTELKSASKELVRMLHDESPDHRLSALWVVERLRLPQVLTQLNAMVQKDPNPHVQVRARRVLQSVQAAKEVARVR